MTVGRMWTTILGNTGITVALVVAFHVALRFSGSETSFTVAWGSALAGVMAVAATLLLGRRSSGVSWSEMLRLRGFAFAALPVLMLTALSFAVFSSSAVDGMESWLPVPGWLQEIFERMGDVPSVAIVSALLFAPMIEEFLFRGYLLGQLAKEYPPRVAIAFSAIGFAGVHLNPYQFLPALLGGVALGWLCLRSGSIWPCVWLHAAYNGSCFLVEGWPSYVNGVHWALNWASGLSGFVVAAITIRLAGRMLSHREQPSS